MHTMPKYVASLGLKVQSQSLTIRGCFYLCVTFIVKAWPQPNPWPNPNQVLISLKTQLVPREQLYSPMGVFEPPIKISETP